MTHSDSNSLAFSGQDPRDSDETASLTTALRRTDNPRESPYRARREGLLARRRAIHDELAKVERATRRLRRLRAHLSAIDEELEAGSRESARPRESLSDWRVENIPGRWVRAAAAGIVIVGASATLSYAYEIVDRRGRESPSLSSRAVSGGEPMNHRLGSRHDRLGSIRSIGDDRWELERRFAERIVIGSLWQSRDTKLVFHSRDGLPGVTISGTDRSLRAVGLRDGDFILSINDYELVSAPRAAFALRALQSAPLVVVELIRDGERRNLVYRIV